MSKAGAGVAPRRSARAAAAEGVAYGWVTVETMVARGVTGVIELAPAGTLAGLAKRGMPGVKTVAVKTPDDLSAALALFAELEGNA